MAENQPQEIAQEEVEAMGPGQLPEAEAES